MTVRSFLRANKPDYERRLQAMPFTETLITILAVSISWLILPLVIALGLLVGLVFLVWHGVPKFSWDAQDSVGEPSQ